MIKDSSTTITITITLTLKLLESEWRESVSRCPGVRVSGCPGAQVPKSSNANGVLLYGSLSKTIPVRVIEQ
jgi:hypothetical protein